MASWGGAERGMQSRNVAGRRAVQETHMKRGDPLDQADLIAAAQKGDGEAFGEIVRQTYVDTYTLAMRLTGNEEDARDVVQETYIRAWKAIDRFRGDAQISTWLYRITANAAYTHMGKRRRDRVETLDDSMLEVADERAIVNPEVMAEASELHERVARALDELPPKLRAIVVLKDVYDLPHEAIAQELGISVTAAKVRLHRARRKLRDILFEESGRSVNAM